MNHPTGRNTQNNHTPPSSDFRPKPPKRACIVDDVDAAPPSPVMVSANELANALRNAELLP